jgi:hypothetical protein
MDFNTGTGGTGGAGGSPREPGRPPPSRTSGVAAGAEFRYTDPVQTFISTVRGVALQPVNFFRGILRQGDFINPLIFAIICWEIAAILGGILTVLGSLAGIGVRTVGESIGAFALSLITTPIVAAIGAFIGAGILHLLVILIVRPANTGFETTFRVVSYSSVSQLVSWIPIIGPIAGAVISVILGIFGIRETHGTTTGKAALVVLIPAAVAFLFVVVVLGAAAFLIFSQR